MKIGILTQPLYCNYGGIVQCYALQTTLKRMGHEPMVLQREFNRRYTFLGALQYYLKLIVKKLMGRNGSWHYYVSQKKRDYIARNTHNFIDKFIVPRSEHCYTTEELKQEVERLHLDAIVVGSDQVWRPDYSPCQTNYFLDFLEDANNVKRLSYAASFGNDRWSWSRELTDRCATLLRKFDGVSVREKSGICLCKKYFGVDAVQVLDPTMLLEAEDYIEVVKQYVLNGRQLTNHRGMLFCYVLDRSSEKRNVIKSIAERTGKTTFEVMPELDDSVYNLYGDIDKSVYPPVEEWLLAFIEAEMVITDSFHGTVFSIINNRPFWVLANEGRGMARFESLLSMFGLENRMLATSPLVLKDLNQPIDWDCVNKRRKELQKSSIDYLRHVI